MQLLMHISKTIESKISTRSAISKTHDIRCRLINVEQLLLNAHRFCEYPLWQYSNFNESGF